MEESSKSTKNQTLSNDDNDETKDTITIELKPPQDRMIESNTISEKDDLQAFLLRAKLSDMKFGVIWSAMKDLGWKFNGAEYITPEGINLGTSVISMEMLDAFSLPHLSLRDDFNYDHHCSSIGISSLSMKRNKKVLHNGENENKEYKTMNMKKARRDLLVKIFSKLDSESRKFHQDSDEDNQKNHESESDNTISIQSRRKRQRKHEKKNGHVSATINEPGTEQYFDKPRRSKRFSYDETVIQFSQGDSIDKNSNENDRHSKQEEQFQNAMKKIVWPQPINSVKAIVTMRKDEPDTNISDISQQYLHANVSEWEFLLSTNHSLLFHGFGSKRFLLNEFANELKSSGDVLILDGLDPDINISSVLDLIVKLFLDGVEPSSNTSINKQIIATTSSAITTSSNVERASQIAHALGAKRQNPIYILIQNIDGIQLRSKDTQNAIATLVSDSNVINRTHSNRSSTMDMHGKERVIRIAATIDHVDSPMFLWDINSLQKFSWIWKRTDTYYPYFEEVTMIIPKETHKTKTFAQKEAIDYVFMEKVLESIAPKHTESLKCLAKLQLSKQGNSDILGEKYDYVEYSEWKLRCFEDLVVNKEQELKKVMGELIDHRVIEKRTDASAGKDYICIPTTRKKVQDILNNLNDK